MIKRNRLFIFAVMISVLLAGVAQAGPGYEGDPEIPLGPAKIHKLQQSPAGTVQSNFKAAPDAQFQTASEPTRNVHETSHWVKIMKAYLRLARIFSL